MTSPWVDVGPLLAAGCTEMGVNDMLHIPHFSLFEAMSAVEIGNVKMDSGATRGMSIDAHLDSGQAPVDLTPEQACAIMDHLMLLEATHYFSGNAAAASVYSSLYMMRPDRQAWLTTACPSLAAYCKGVEATCLAVRWFLMNGAVSEEEDISLLISGLPLEEAPGGIAHLPSEDCLPQLLAAQKAAAQAAADCATAPEQAGVWDRIGQHLTFRHALIKALLQLKQKNGPALHTAQKALTQAAAQLAKLHASPPRTAAPIAADGPGAAQSDVLAAKVCSNGSGSAAKQPGCEGAGVGSSAQQSGLGVVGAEGPACLGYVPGLNHHLLYPAPPRATQMMSEVDSRQQWATLLTHLQAAAALDDILGWRALQLHVLKLAGLRMGVVARCIAHYLVAGKAWSASNAGQHAAGPGGSSSSSSNSGPSQGSIMGPGNDEWPSWVLDTPMICEALALPVLKSLGPDVDMFLEQAVIAAGNWVQAMLLNPCRQRRRLRRGLEDWAHLYQHALNADLSPEFQAWMSAAGWRWVPGQAGPPDTVSGAPDPQPCSTLPPHLHPSLFAYPHLFAYLRLSAIHDQGVLATWVESETALSQYSHLLLGFKLDLYRARHGPHLMQQHATYMQVTHTLMLSSWLRSVQEYCLIFWYSASLLETRKHALQLLHSVQAPVPKKGPQLPSGGKAKKSTKPLPPSPATVRRQAGLLADAVLCEQYASLAVGLVRLLAGLQAAGLTKAPKLPFNTLREQFDQRFASFHSPSLVKPVPLSFARLPLARWAESEQDATNSYAPCRCVLELEVCCAMRGSSSIRSSSSSGSGGRGGGGRSRGNSSGSSSSKGSSRGSSSSSKGSSGSGSSGGSGSGGSSSGGSSRGISSGSSSSKGSSRGSSSSKGSSSSGISGGSGSGGSSSGGSSRGISSGSSSSKGRDQYEAQMRLDGVLPHAMFQAAALTFTNERAAEQAERLLEAHHTQAN
ncbi:hypothetical protein QJQ45_022115 [Haematococcus lacustris]|nr:hypothetical protein QJQ45_022115 [Haematococcus lacustris]